MVLLNNNSSQTLTKRGLLEAIVKAGWELSKSGAYFLIPIVLPDGTLVEWQAKYNVDELARAKFGKVNLKGKPSHIKYYMLPDFPESLIKSDGWLYLASGVTDLLTYHAAGLPNVIAPIAGEMAIPKDFAQDLISWGVKGLVYLPDNDDIGKKSAAKVAARLEGSGIDYRVRLLHPMWKDANDLWMYCLPFGIQQAQHLFLDTVRRSEKISIDTVYSMARAVTKHSRRTSKRKNSSRRAWRANQQALQQVIVGLGIRGFDGDKSLPIKCPFHHDEHASAVLFLNTDTGKPFFYCSGCDNKSTFAKLCSYLGITDYREYQAEVDVSSRDLDESPSLEDGGDSDGAVHVDNPVDTEDTMPLGATTIGLETSELQNPICLPQNLRRWLIKANYEKLAIFMDVLLAAKVELGKAYTARELHQLTQEHYNYGSLRNMLREFCTKLASPYIEPIDTENPLFSSVTLYTENFVQNSGRGRRQQAYIIPTIPELMKHFSVRKTGKFTPLPPDALQSPKAYRQAVHLLNVEENFLIWHESDEFPAAAALSREVGVSPRTLSNYEKSMPSIGKIRRWLRQEVDATYQVTEKEKKAGVHVVNRGEKHYRMQPLTSKRWFIYSESDIHKAIVCYHCHQEPLAGCHEELPSQCDFCGCDHPWETIEIVDKKPRKPKEKAAEAPISAEDVVEDAPLLDEKATQEEGVIAPETSPVPKKKELHCKYCSQMPMFVDDPGDYCDYCKAINPWQEFPPLETSDPPEHEKWIDPNQKKKRKKKQTDMNPSEPSKQDKQKAAPPVDTQNCRSLPWWEFLFEDSSDYLLHNEAAKLIKTVVMLRLGLTEEMLLQQKIGYNVEAVRIVDGGHSTYVPPGIIFPHFVGSKIRAVSVYRWTGSDIEPDTTVVVAKD